MAAVSFRLVTDANVAARVPYIAYTHGAGAAVPIAYANVQQAASSDYRYVGHFNASGGGVGTVCGQIALPDRLELLIVDHLSIEVTNIQVGDQLSAINHWWLLDY